MHVEKELASRKFYVVGEIGIDLFWDKLKKKKKKNNNMLFKHQIQLAKSTN